MIWLYIFLGLVLITLFCIVLAGLTMWWKNRQLEKAVRAVNEGRRQKYGTVPTPDAVKLLEAGEEEQRKQLADIAEQGKALQKKLPPPEEWAYCPYAFADGGKRLYRKGNKLLLLKRGDSLQALAKAVECAQELEAALALPGTEPLQKAILQVDEKWKADNSTWEKFLYTLQSADFRLLGMDDIAYYSVDTQTTQEQKTSFNSTKAPSLLGTAAREALGGSAYATAKAMQKNAEATTTTVTSKTTKSATLYFNYDCGEQPLCFSDSFVKDLEALIPEKRK